jgi:hypothetical protein
MPDKPRRLPNIAVLLHRDDEGISKNIIKSTNCLVIPVQVPDGEPLDGTAHFGNCQKVSHIVIHKQPS